MGGSVGVESTPEKGSCFWIELKRLETMAPSPPLEERAGERRPFNAAPANSMAVWQCSERNSLRALVDPRPDQSNLFPVQRRDLIFVIRRGHEIVFIADMGDVVNENAAGAIPGQHNLAVLAAL